MCTPSTTITHQCALYLIISRWDVRVRVSYSPVPAIWKTCSFSHRNNRTVLLLLTSLIYRIFFSFRRPLPLVSLFLFPTFRQLPLLHSPLPTTLAPPGGGANRPIATLSIKRKQRE